MAKQKKNRSRKKWSPAAIERRGVKAYCFRCKRKTKVKRGSTTKTRGHNRVKGRCGSCGRKVSVFVPGNFVYDFPPAGVEDERGLYDYSDSDCASGTDAPLLPYGCDYSGDESDD